MQRLREWLVLGLIALLPLHALGITVLTKLIAGPGHAPLSFLAFWKEAVLGVVLLFACIEWIRKGGYRSLSFDRIDAAIVALAVLALLVTLLNGIPSRSALLLGLKYDVFPLAVFFVLRRADWSAFFDVKAMAVVAAAGGIVAMYGIVGFFLPQGFFTFLGYSDLHSLYVPDGPLAPFQQIGGSALHRIQSTMSGPNQLGIWLLMPLSVAAFAALSKRSALNIGFFLTLLAALALTFSRAAWIGAFVLLATLAFLRQSRLMRRKMFLWGTPAALVLLVIAASVFPSIILRSSSTRGHLEKPIAGIRAMIEDPLGRGLGTAGPATNRVSDACVELEKGSDASWAAAHPDLCVFVGDERVQPVGRECDCPFVTENWYIQIGVELGIAGFALFLALVFFLARGLLRIPGPSPVALAFLGICVCALFLHAFEDSTVAYTLFLLAAISLKAEKARISER